MHELLKSGHLQTVSGAAADGHHQLTSARQLLESSHREQGVNPEASFILAYDAARKACSSLLAHQGLRTKSNGHHVTTERVVRLQFGGVFHRFPSLRRRRSEIEYPRFSGEDVQAEESARALQLAREIVSAAERLIGELTRFETGPASVRTRGS